MLDTKHGIFVSWCFQTLSKLQLVNANIRNLSCYNRKVLFLCGKGSYFSENMNRKPESKNKKLSVGKEAYIALYRSVKGCHEKEADLCSL